MKHKQLKKLLAVGLCTLLCCTLFTALPASAAGADLIAGGDMQASGLNGAWKTESQNDPDVEGRMITYIGGYRNVNGAAYLLKRTNYSEGSTFLYQELPVSAFDAGKDYTLKAYVRGYQIDPGKSGLPDTYGTYLYVQYLDSSKNIINTKFEAKKGKIPFGYGDWKSYTLNFTPSADNAAFVRVGIYTEKIMCEIAIDDVTLVPKGATPPSYLGEVIAPSPDNIKENATLDPLGGVDADAPISTLKVGAKALFDNATVLDDMSAYTTKESLTDANSAGGYMYDFLGARTERALDVEKKSGNNFAKLTLYGANNQYFSSSIGFKKNADFSAQTADVLRFRTMTKSKAVTLFAALNVKMDENIHSVIPSTVYAADTNGTVVAVADGYKLTLPRNFDGYVVLALDGHYRLGNQSADGIPAMNTWRSVESVQWTFDSGDKDGFNGTVLYIGGLDRANYSADSEVQSLAKTSAYEEPTLVEKPDTVPDTLSPSPSATNAPQESAGSLNWIYIAVAAVLVIAAVVMAVLTRRKL